MDYIYLRVSITLNLAILVGFAIKIIYHMYKEGGSILDDSFSTKIYLIYIAPSCLVALNLLINIIYKPTLLMWIIGGSPVIIPIANLAIEESVICNRQKLYDKYSEPINSLIVDYMKLNNFCIDIGDIHLFFRYKGKSIYCGITIEADIIESHKTSLENNLINILIEKYPNILFDLSIEDIYKK